MDSGGKHTPGPWTVDTNGGGRFSNSIAAKVVASGLIADVSDWWYDVGQAEANAHLIAAAPDLLEALVELLPLADDEVSHTYDNVLDIARAAIAKARGA